MHLCLRLYLLHDGRKEMTIYNAFQLTIVRVVKPPSYLNYLLVYVSAVFIEHNY